MNEIYKPIIGYEGRYEVSNLGNVRTLNYNNTKKSKVINPVKRGGYLRVALVKNKKRKWFSIHRLVVEAFVSQIPYNKEVHHIDENKENNKLSNLAIVSHKENINFGTRTKRAGATLSVKLQKELHLMEKSYPYRELTFPSSYHASSFFGYKNKTAVGSFLYYAKKKGKNYITCRGVSYYFLAKG